MIDHKKVEASAQIITNFFIDLNKNVKDISFIENYLGLVYAYNKINKALSSVDILKEEQMKKICEVLENLAKNEVDENLFNSIKEKLNEGE